MLLPHGQALLGGYAVDAALGVKDGVDPPHGFGRQRRACKLSQLEWLATPVDYPNTIAWEVLCFSLSVPFATHIAEPRRRGLLAH